jgi:23S rRNA (uracil1939-C5)-methyltransferase
VLDLYAGAGNFSLPLAGEAIEVIAVEEHPAAIHSGKENCFRNGIGNVRFVQSPLEQYVPDAGIDAIVLDPPRLGLSNRVVEMMLEIGAARVVYVSCNPSTFARDLRKFAEAYAVTSVRLIDFFPQTYHLEAMAVLEKK